MTVEHEKPGSQHSVIARKPVLNFDRVGMLVGLVIAFLAALAAWEVVPEWRCRMLGDCSLRRGALYGGPGGNGFDDADANPSHISISDVFVTVSENPNDRNQVIIGRLQVQWGVLKGAIHGYGPPDRLSEHVHLEKGELIREIDVSDMPFNWPGAPIPPDWITGIRIITDHQKYEFGNMNFGPINKCLIREGEKFLGFFGQSGSYVDRVGCIFA